MDETQKWGGCPPPPQNTLHFLFPIFRFQFWGWKLTYPTNFGLEAAVSNYAFPLLGMEADISNLLAKCLNNFRSKLDRNRRTEPQMSRESAHPSPNEWLR